MFRWFRRQKERSTSNTTGEELHIALSRKLLDFLAKQISVPKRAALIIADVKRSKELLPASLEKELPKLYLTIEHFLVTQDPLQKYTRSNLRKTVKYRYEPLLKLPNFKLIFETEIKQELLLSQMFLRKSVEYVKDKITDINQEFLEEILTWLGRIPEVSDHPIPLSLSKEIPQTEDEWPPFLSAFSKRLFRHLKKFMGKDLEYIYERSYRELAHDYELLETFPTLIQLLPDQLLDKEKIEHLSHDTLRTLFFQKLAELQDTSSSLPATESKLKNLEEEISIANNTTLETVNLFHSVLETVQEGIITWEPSGKIILVNEKVKEMFGYSEEELVGNNIEMIIPEKDNKHNERGLQKCLAHEQSALNGQKINLKGLRKDQTLLPLEMCISKKKSEDKIYCTAAIRIRAEEVQGESALKAMPDDSQNVETLYRSLSELSTDIHFTLSPDGTFTYLNKAFEKITGWQRDEWLEKSITQIVHPDVSKYALKLVQKALQGEKAAKIELRLRRQSNSYLLTEFSISPILQAGKTTGAIGIAKDISFLSKQRDILREKEELYQQLLELFPQAIGVQLDGKLTFINRIGLKILGAKETRQLLNRPMKEFVHPDYHQKLNGQIAQLKDSNNTIPVKKAKLLRLDGQEIEVEIAEAPIFFHKKKGTQFVFRDITTVREANSLLDIAEEEIRNLNIKLQSIQAQIQAKQAKYNELGKKLEAKQKEIQEIKGKQIKLAELIPVCSSCQKIRDDSGYWHGLEQFVKDTSNLELIRGICPECAANVAEAINGTNDKPSY